MYDTLEYNDLIDTLEPAVKELYFPQPCKKITRRLMFAVKCSRNGISKYVFCSSQNNSHAITNVIYEFHFRFPFHVIESITPTDVHIVD